MPKISGWVAQEDCGAARRGGAVHGGVCHEAGATALPPLTCPGNTGLHAMDTCPAQNVGGLSSHVSTFTACEVWGGEATPWTLRIGRRADEKLICSGRTGVSQQEERAEGMARLTIMASGPAERQRVQITSVPATKV